MTIPPSSSSISSSSASSQSHHPQHYHHYFRADEEKNNAAVRRTPPTTGYYTPRAPTPLVLDPRRANPSSTSQSPASSAVIQKLFNTSSTKRPNHLPPQQRYITPKSTPSLMDQPDSPEEPPQDTAAAFARSSPKVSLECLISNTRLSVVLTFCEQAGFLMKLGTNIPELKRRFFVLKPSTHLYYFLSPHDKEPRGCMDLDGASVQLIQELPDGRMRFRISWANTPDNRVVLEARSREAGNEWMEALQKETLAHYRCELEGAHQQASGLQTRIDRLEKEVSTYRMVEQDRDGALQDAANWKRKYCQLNEAIRKLTQELRRAPEVGSGGSMENENATEDDAEAGSGETVSENLGELQVSSDRSTPLELDTKMESEETPKTANIRETIVEIDDSGSNKENSDNDPRETSLLDLSIEQDDFNIDELNVPGTHFSALNNTCQQLRDNVRLVSVEASTALQDLSEANMEKEALQKRMDKAEKHLCKLWEENTTVRQELKVVKKEKRVLVKEVRTLRTKTAAPSLLQDMPVDLDSTPELLADKEGERLIEDLEQHVESSLRLHEQFLAANRSMTNIARNALIGHHQHQQERDSVASSDAIRRMNVGPGFSRSDASGMSKSSPIQPTNVLSLFDHDSDESEEDATEVGDEDTASALTSCLSSVGAEMGDYDASSIDTGKEIPEVVQQKLDVIPDDDESGNADADQSFERKHPLLKLDEDEDMSETDLFPISSASTRSIITDNGHATTRLDCPLADVVETSESDNDHSQGDGQVYHVTFYSRKIGIQFQKVPPAPARGALAEAMTADLRGHDATDSEKTAGELRRIAQMSRNAKGGNGGSDQMTNLNVATPVDSVLVCGFHGFDDSGGNSRPKLGARLVAFDGVSIEYGQWTFESIRKAIQARSRPLTLSFRNDFLTTKQREILTKAVNEVDQSMPPSQRRPGPANDSTIRRNSRSSASHDSERLDGQSTDDGSVGSSRSHSIAGSSTYAPYSFSANNSVMSGSNFRSFSEAGSSAVSSAVGPLLAKLSRDRPAFSYLSTEGTSVEAMADHIDFQSSLL